MQNVIYLTVNLTEINESSLNVDLQPKTITFEAKAGRYVGRFLVGDDSIYAHALYSLFSPAAHF